MFWAYIDGSRRKIWALLTDGTIWAYRAQAVTLTAGTIRIGSASVYNANWVVFTAPDASGNYQVYKQNRATGQVTALTTTGNHTDLQINGSVAAWLTDGTYSDYCDLDAGIAGPVTARPLIWAVGHSMLANYATNRQPPLPDKVASALNWPLANFAIQGAGSAQQVARAGLVATTLTVTGNTIPASGPVTITAVTPNDFIVSAYGPRSIYGWLGGVYGYLTWDSVAGERFWRATAGDAVPISAGATWIPDVGLAFSGVALIWTLVNDDHGSAGRAASLANLNMIVAALKSLGKRFVILREFPRTTDTIGSASRADIDALNAAVQAAYPNNWLDLMPTLYANAAPSDATAVSQGLVPPSLSAGDGFHLGNAGNDLATVAIVNFIKAKGWA
ncbi:hypothetical protein C8K11_1151 [Novosphingobium sp. GV055]|nr:hypothetical protein C8K11_1151 [Novosphingobium sp. GV055]PUB00231.1 hypothetical protein C8K12_1151 [Novosphingobium sp. GV061]PUB15272.1 hypothetical protein C8K14_1151 [Novosphingobium sp. GV079]PUB39148.1 hypothetical protein C8K10_1151 [Novosphingobium sp. GV027]